MLVIGGEDAHRHVVLLRHAHHAHAALVEAAHAVEHLRGELRRERQNLGTHLDLAAHAEHLLDGALGDELALARAVLDHHAHAPAVEVEGDLVCQVPLAAGGGDRCGLGGDARAESAGARCDWRCFQRRAIAGCVIACGGGLRRLR